MLIPHLFEEGGDDVSTYNCDIQSHSLFWSWWPSHRTIHMTLSFCRALQRGPMHCRRYFLCSSLSELFECMTNLVHTRFALLCSPYSTLAILVIAGTHFRDWDGIRAPVGCLKAVGLTARTATPLNRIQAIKMRRNVKLKSKWTLPAFLGNSTLSYKPDPLDLPNCIQHTPRTILRGYQMRKPNQADLSTAKAGEAVLPESYTRSAPTAK